MHYIVERVYEILVGLNWAITKKVFGWINTGSERPQLCDTWVKGCMIISKIQYWQSLPRPPIGYVKCYTVYIIVMYLGYLKYLNDIVFNPLLLFIREEKV